MTIADMKYKVLTKLAEHYQQHGYSSTVDVSDVPQTILEPLEAKRYIEIHPSGATITKRGLLAYSVEKKERGEAIRPAPQTPAETVVLTETAHGILRYLGAVENGRYLDVIGQNTRAVNNLERTGLLRSKPLSDGRRGATLTAAGRDALSNYVIYGSAEHYHYKKTRRNQDTPEPVEAVEANTTIETAPLDDTPEPDNGVKIGEEALTSDPRTRGNDNGSTTIPPACDTCINRRIVEMLASKHPNIGRLAGKLLESEALQREIDALVEEL